MSTPISPAVATALTILELLGVAPELGVTELARNLGTGKSSVHRLLNTLASRGYIEKSPQTARYRLSCPVWSRRSCAGGSEAPVWRA